MNVIYTEQALESLSESLVFLIQKQGLSIEQAIQIENLLINNAEKLADNPFKGQKEEYLQHLSLGHRRIVLNTFKIIYRVAGNNIYVTDFFDTRQDPVKMNG